MHKKLAIMPKKSGSLSCIMEVFISFFKRKKKCLLKMAINALDSTFSHKTYKEIAFWCPPTYYMIHKMFNVFVHKAIVLSFLLRYTDSDYLFGIFKLFFYDIITFAKSKITMKRKFYYCLRNLFVLYGLYIRFAKKDNLTFFL